MTAVSIAAVALERGSTRICRAVPQGRRRAANDVVKSFRYRRQRQSDARAFREAT
jgi:hypothetical protein